MLIGRELVEAGDPAMSASERAIKSLQDELLERVAVDPGLCVPSDRTAVRKMISVAPSALVKPGHAWHVVNAWVSAARSTYLENWAVALERNTALPSAERTARLIGAHLLDEGFGRDHLHRWLTYRVKYSDDTHPLESICRELHGQLERGPVEFEILVPLRAQPPLPQPTPLGWLTAPQVREWRARNIPGGAPIRQYGGILLSVEALDPHSAADKARLRLTTILDRVRVGGRHEIVPDRHMWIAGLADQKPTEAAQRRVEVHAFERQDVLWRHRVRGDIEAAMELMAPLERGASPAAVTGAWAAIESLLVGPGDDDKQTAGDRLALLVASGHLRAEMTTLAWAHTASETDALATAIEGARTNQERAEFAFGHLVGGGDLSLLRSDDRHALLRARVAIGDPYRYVESVRAALQPAMRALYRQRNLLSHAGGTSGVAINPTLERVAPLVAAGMDRIVHVALTGGQSALELAALARVRHEALRGKPPAAALAILEV